MRLRAGWTRAIGMLLAAGALGCAGAPQVYVLPLSRYVEDQASFPNAAPQIELGPWNALVDGLNHYVLSLPGKILLLNWRFMDHQVAPADLALLERYLALNHMTAVKVRHNEYAPIAEFRRLTQNRDVGAGYRYTLGIVAWLQYTLLPDRLFGGLLGSDNFNPFSNTINVYSSDPAVLLHEAGHAKDYLEHSHRGTSFILISLVPGVSLFHEYTASADTIRYLYCVHEGPREVEAYRSLLPAYGTYVGGVAGGNPLVTVPVVVVGHIAAYFKADERERALAEGPGSAVFPDYCVPGAEPEAAPAPSPGS